LSIKQLTIHLLQEPDKQEDENNHQKQMDKVAATPSANSSTAPSASQAKANQPYNQDNDDQGFKHDSSPRP